MVVAALAAAAAGCGGSGGENEVEGYPGFEVVARTVVTTADPPLAKGRFLAEVAAICRRAWPTVEENFAEYSGWQREDGLGGAELYATSARDSYLAGVDFHIFDEIYNLGGPEGEEEEVEEIIGAMQTAVELGQRRVRVESPAELRALFADYNRLARAYGLDGCLVAGGNLPRLSG